jgi:DNA-binding NtrC family response regulator
MRDRFTRGTLPAVLIAADGRVAQPLQAAFTAAGHRSAVVTPGAAAANVARLAPQILVLEAESPADLERLPSRDKFSATTLVIVANPSSEALAIAAIRCGAADYVTVPFDPVQLVTRLQATAAPAPVQRPPAGTSSVPALVGTSAALERVREFVAAVGPTDATVLITGETGTGKELVAELLHRSSRRHAARLVSINCPALPDALFESELFGHERGAFTGAEAAEGRLHAAHGGTVFLDEVAELSISAQAKLLRTIEASEVATLGRPGTTRLNLRFMSATNQDLERLGDEGRFRRDLYYRLKVCHVHLPPLRDRPEDIPALFELFLQRFAGAAGPPACADAALSALVAYSWPGNVREIRNTVEGLLPFVRGGRIELGDLPEHLRRGSAESIDERGRILATLRGCRWNKREAARALRWSRMTLYRKLAKHGIGRQPHDAVSRDMSDRRVTPARK